MATQAPIPPTMRAWSFSKAGNHRQVLALNSIASPKSPVGDQVLIRVAYCGLNPGDTKVMRLMPNLMRPKDSVPGQDYSGTIIARGPTAPSYLTLGTKVFGVLDAGSFFRGEGTLCEYICISSSKCMVTPLPENVSLQDASSLGAAGMMAFMSCRYGDIKPGNGYRVLVNGASGGCGTLFLQVVLGMGAKEVVATCSAPNEELVKSLGASETIDYRKHAPLHAYLAKEHGHRPFDFILDTVGDQALYTNSPKYLKPAGTFMNIGDYTHGTLRTLWYWISNTYWPKWLFGTPRRFVMFQGGVDRELEELVVQFLREGKLHAVIERAVDMAGVLEAFDVVAARRTRGRIVVKVEE